MKKLMLIAFAALAFGAIATITLPTAARAATDSQTIINNGLCDSSGTTYSAKSKIAGCNATDTQNLDGSGQGKSSYIKTLVDTALYIAGTVATLFIILGGIRYITATGDATRVTKAKNTVLYAIIGLIVTILAFPLTGFIIEKIGG